MKCFKSCKEEDATRIYGGPTYADISNVCAACAHSGSCGDKGGSF